jgi:NAD(P)-dependent dehydrogenase (short-subunit alcohol dehydrogenase family)
MGLLENKVAFITGAASGIGASIARRFAEEGAAVTIADMDSNRGEQVRADIESKGGHAIFVHCDVSDPASMQNAITATVEQFGKLDIVCANAGINGVWAPIEELEPDEWDRTMSVNLKGTYLAVHFAVPHLVRSGGGSIIITSSVNGTRVFATPGTGAYSTSKGAQVAFMKMMAVELARYSIRCNAVCPGFIKTNINERTERRNIDSIGIKIELPQNIPAISYGPADPVVVADTCVFLASDLSRPVSGTELFADAGLSLLR